MTTLPAAQAPTETIVLFGHERWRIENEAFSELSNLWNADHYFHHHPNSIVAPWLLLFIAHALFHCFLRNLKPHPPRLVCLSMGAADARRVARSSGLIGLANRAT